MKKTFMVIGLGRFGSNVAKTLASMKRDVLAVDINEESVKQIAKDVQHCVVADATKISVLTELGADHIDHAVVAIGNNLQSSILTVVNLKKIGVKQITVRADSEEHKEIFSLVGATEIIIPEEETAISLANQINSDTILEYYIISGKYVMVNVVVGKDFGNKNLKDLDLRNNFDINIVGIIRNNEFFVPRWDDKLMLDDVAVVAGLKKDINKFDSYLNN